jgi:hypothetical protein
MPPVAAAAMAIGSAVSAGVAAVGAGLATVGAAVGVTGGLTSIATGAMMVGSATQLVGAMTGSKTLSKIGGFMSMAGGVGSIAGMAGMGGAANAAGMAGSAAKGAANAQYGLNMGNKFAAQQGGPIGLLGGGTGDVAMPTMSGMPQLTQATQATQAALPTAGQQASSPTAATPAATNSLSRAEELLTKYDRTADILGGVADAYMENAAQKNANKQAQKTRDFNAEQAQIDRDRAGSTIKTQNLRSLLQNTRF